MKRTKQLLLIVAFSLLCGQAYAQEFIEIDPELLEIDLPGGEVFNGEFDISSALELAENSVILSIENGFLNNSGGSFTVSDSEETTFSVEGSVPVLARLSHGSNLGGANDVARDGIRTAPGEFFTFVSNLDDGFEEGNGNASGTGTLFIEFVGVPPANGDAASNSNNFVFESDGAFTELDVFTTNTPDFNNNFGFFVAVAPVPEPASGLVLTCVVGSFLMRRKRS